MSDSARFALAVNAGIASAKGVAGLLTGSAAMTSEAVHSVADCTAQVMLIIGDKREAKRPAAPYVWGASAAAFMFVSGGLFNVWHGVHELLTGKAANHAVWVSLVMITILGLASYGEFASMVNAGRNLAATRGTLSWLRHLRASDDTKSVMVIMEDATDIAGNTVALIGIALAMITGITIIDALASIMVGVLLIIVATELVTRNVRLAKTV